MYPLPVHAQFRRWYRLVSFLLVFTFVFTALPTPASFITPLPVSAVASQSPTVTDSWSPAAPMSVPRTLHTATLLNNGKVLVVGGFFRVRSEAGEIYDTAELYDPAMNSWSSAGVLSAPRGGHTATLLNDGRVLVVGGRTVGGGLLPFGEIYDPLTNSWATSATMITARIWHKAVLLKNGKVLVAGGSNDITQLASAELYDPTTDAWSATPNMVSPRWDFPMIRLNNDKILVTGGYGDPNGSYNGAELYDPDSNSWVSLAPMQTIRTAHGGVLLNDGKVLVVGGQGTEDFISSTELYDPTNNSWTSAGNLSTGKRSSVATLLSDGQVLVTGGGMSTGPLSAVERYDPTTNAWTTVASMSTPRNGHTATLLGNGKVLVTGGLINGTNTQATVELYSSTGCDPAVILTCQTTLALEVSGPPALTVSNGQYTPNPFQINGTVRNTGANDAQHVQVTLYLPAGLAFISGSATQVIGALAVGGEQQVTWNVRATGLSETATLNYFLVAAALNAESPSVGSQITMPSLFSVTAVYPNTGGNTGRVTLSIQGSGFENGASVQLGNVPAQNVTVISPELIKATFDLNQQPSGSLSISVNNPSGSIAAAPQPFSVVNGGVGKLSLDLIGPPVVRIGDAANFKYVIRNDGLTDLENVELRLTFNSPPSLQNISAGAINSLGQIIGSFTTSPIFSCARVDMEGDDDCRRKGIDVALALALFIAAHERLEDLKADMIKFRCGTPIQHPDCVNIAALLPAAHTAEQVAGNTLNGACANYPSHCPLKFLCNAFQVYLAVKNYIDFYEYIKNLVDVVKTFLYASGVIDQASASVCPVTSADPNDKYGSAGIGVARFVIDNTSFSYNVVFENKPNATAPAQEVLVTDQLDVGKLDLSTFTFGPINFGNTQITPPPGLQQYATDVDLRPANNLIVRVNAGLDSTTGLITWRFISLDPETGLPTTDPLAGFLPPNQSPPEGDGGVFYFVSPKAGLATGSEIRNKATIIFDTNEPIDTPEWLNTIDNSTPSSQVAPLAATQTAANFAVSWSGSDTGSGIQDYSVFVATDGGPYTLWMTDTTATSGTFNGLVGSNYAFASVARDAVGYVEALPTTPDATTQVIAAPTTTSITIVKDAQPDNKLNFSFAGSLGSFKLDDSVPDDRDKYTNAKTFTVNPGVYTVGEKVPSKWLLGSITCSPTAKGLVDLLNKRVAITVATGDNVICTFTNQMVGTIRAQKYHDRNSNGRWDKKEPNLAGWKISLYNAQNTLIATQITNKQGKVSFTKVPASMYTLCEELTTGWVNTQPPTLLQPINKPCYTLTLNGGQTAEALFGNSNTSAVNSTNISVNDGLLIYFDVESEADDDTYVEDDNDEKWLNTQDQRNEIYIPLIAR